MRMVSYLVLAFAVWSDVAAGQESAGEWLGGLVVEAGSGNAIEGAMVRVDGPASRAAITGGDGAWRVGPLPAGVYEVTVAHVGYATGGERVQVPRDAPLRVALSTRPLALNALVVTGGRRTQRLSEAIVATELVTRQEIRETGASDLASVLTERTGVELQGGHPAGSGVMIQGMGSERVLVLLDGQPFIGRISGQIDVSRIPTSMIERVEVVKGPQSTLYGSEAMGGVVNVITRNPTNAEWTSAITATAGNHGRIDVAGNVMGGAGAFTTYLDAGRRSLKLAPGLADESGSLANRWDAIGKVGWKSDTRDLGVEASVLWLDERQRWQSGQLYQFADNTQWSGRLGGTWQHGGQRISPTFFVTSFNHLSRRATSEEPVTGTGEQETQHLAELDLLYGASVGSHSFDAGIEARRERIRSDRVSGATRNEEAVEAFAQSAFRWGSFSFVPGVRATWSGPWGTHWTPRLAALYRPMPEIALRVSAGEGFRAPGFKELYMEFLNVGPGFGYTVRGNPGLQPEVSRNLTASFEWAGARTFLRVQAFDNRFEDFIETRAVGDSSGVTVYTYGNVDDGVTRGVEIEGGVVWNAWRFEGGYNVLRARSNAGDEPLLGRPERSARAAVSFAHPSGFRFSFAGTHTGETPMQRSSTGTEWRQPFTRFDLRVARDLPGNLEAVLGVDNLFDRSVPDWPGFTGRHLYTTISWRRNGR